MQAAQKEKNVSRDYKNLTLPLNAALGVSLHDKVRGGGVIVINSELPLSFDILWI